MAKNRASFGFRKVNGRAIKLQVTSVTAAGLMTRDAPKRLKRGVVRAMNEAGRIATRRAKNPNWTPKLKGWLIQSIQWIEAKETAKGNIVNGEIRAGDARVPYARIQEETNPRKPHFLARAIRLIAQPEFEKRLRSQRVFQKAIVGRTGFTSNNF